MKLYNRRHPRGSYTPTSISLSGDLLKEHSTTITSLISVLIDLNPQVVGADLTETAERISRYLVRSIAQESSGRLLSSENEEDKRVLGHYVKGEG